MQVGIELVYTYKNAKGEGQLASPKEVSRITRSGTIDKTFPQTEMVSDVG